MKHIIYFIAFIILFATNAKSQTFALNIAGKQMLTTYSQSGFAASRPHPNPPGALTIIGGCSIGIGVGIAACGLVVIAFDYDAADEKVIQNEWKDGHTAEVIGGLTIAAGIGMCIAGGIRDHKKHQGNRYGIIAPKKNEVGFAYNF